VSPSTLEPKVVAERQGFRLVHQTRDARAWPNTSDLVLEHFQVDAMGVGRWVHVTSWCLSAQYRPVKSEDTVIVALKMLLDPGPVVTDKRP
jgi:hypothetical protein